MAPQSKKRRSPRNKLPFSLRDAMVYGIPIWVGAPIAGWYADGLIGLQSVLAGLFILSAYIGSMSFVARRSKKMSARKTVAIAVAGFWARLVGLWLLVFILSRFLELNLLVLLVTIAFGFTAILATNVKNWLQD